MSGRDTKLLLVESNKGSKMAVASIERAIKSAEASKLRMTLSAYRRVHTQLGNRLHGMLLARGIPDKEPGVFAKAMANLSMGIRLRAGEVDSQIAKIMMDGCNMGIQSLATYRNRYGSADKECRNLVDEMIACERSMMVQMERYL